LRVSICSFAQGKIRNYDYWMKQLSKSDAPVGQSSKQLLDVLLLSDSSSVFDFFQQMEKKNRFADHYVKVRLKCLNIYFRIKYHYFQSKSELIILTEEALNEALETGDEKFIAFVCFICGANALGYQEMELAATYLMKGQELYDRFGQSTKQSNDDWIVLGEVLFHCREYEKSIFYTRKVIETYNDTIANADYLRVRFHNTMGQNFDELGMMDSA